MGDDRLTCMLHWNASPEIVALGPLHLRWYGMLFAIGFYLGYRINGLMFRDAQRSQTDLDRFFLYVFAGTLLGARLGHCFFYEPEVYLPAPWKILEIWQGGLASHGAFIGVAIACFAYARRAKWLTGLQAFDFLAVTAPLAGAFIRVGNFFNSEIIGKPTGKDWGVVFERVDAVARHPSQLYEATCYLVLFALQITLWKKRRLLQHEGRATGIFMVYVFIARFLLEFTKENQVAFESSLPLNMGQLLSLPMIAIGVWLIARKAAAARG